jgi:hypothetical protein
MGKHTHAPTIQHCNIYIKKYRNNAEEEKSSSLITLIRADMSCYGKTKKKEWKIKSTNGIKV